MLVSYTRRNPTTRILEWNVIEDRVKFPYVHEIGKGFDEFHAIRIDEDDNIWAVAPTASEAFEFNTAGELLLRFGATPASDPDAVSPAPLPRPARRYLNRPMDVALDRTGNVFVLDGWPNPRIARFDRRGQFVTSDGGRGSKPGELNSPHSLAVDANGNVYVADGGNARIQVFSNALAPVAVYDTVAIHAARSRHPTSSTA